MARSSNTFRDGSAPDARRCTIPADESVAVTHHKPSGNPAGSPHLLDTLAKALRVQRRKPLSTLTSGL